MRRILSISLIMALFTTGSWALAQQKIDFMFPAPVDGKITQEMTKIIKQYNASQDEVEVRGIFTGDYDTTKMKAESAAKAGQPPALVIMAANYTVDLALQDIILPMDELFKYSSNDEKATDFLLNNFWPAMHKNAQMLGVTYAIPFHNSTPLLYYNKKLFDEVGIKEPPKTWEELVDIAQKLTNKSKGQWGIMLPSTNNDYGGWVLSTLTHANGGYFNNPDYPGEVYYDAPSTRGTLQFWKDLVYKHEVMPEGVLNSKQIGANFFGNKLGMAILSTGALGFMIENSKNIDMEVAMLPTKERNAVIIGGASLVSFKGISEEEKKAAYQFLTYLVSPEISGEWSRFTGYFAPRMAAYDMPVMQEYLDKEPRAKVALEQLQYAYPWYATYETVVVRKAIENELAKVVSNKDYSADEAAKNAQKKADEIMKPYQDISALKVVK